MVEKHRDLGELRNLVAGPLRPVTIDRVYYELQRLAREGPTKSAGLARIALKVLEAQGVEVLDTIFGLPDVDTALVAAALGEKAPTMVATVDRHLRQTLSKHRISSVFPTRQYKLAISR